MNKNFSRCQKCILSASFPNIEYDEKGVCNFCRDQIYYTTESRAISKAERRVFTLLEETRGKKEYDAVMCFSGGKDSTYTLLTAIEKFGLKVLSFTLDNGFISPAALENINRTVEYLGVDQVTIRPSSHFFNRLVRASALEQIYAPKTLVRISSICNSCISLVNINALKIALEKDIPFILAGFTLGQIPANSVLYKNNYYFFQESREKHLKRLRKLLGDPVDDYFCIRDSLLAKCESFPHNINLLCLENPSEEEILSKIGRIGWISPSDVDGCSSNCQLNGFNNFIHCKTFGYNPYELELSHLIRKGKITRDEAMGKVQDQFDRNRLQEIMERLDITESDIENIASISSSSE